MERSSPTEQHVYFEDLHANDPLPVREHGPLTIIDTVRWAGVQENSQQLHFDRDFVREHNGLRTFIASGSYREALLVRMITDWIGPRGMLRKISIRQTASTFEGDTMRFSGHVGEKSADDGDPWVNCEIEGTNQDGERIIEGRCTLVLPTR